MDPSLLSLEGEHYTRPQSTDPAVHTSGHTETTPPKRGSTKKLPRELTWFACQAVKLDLEGKVRLRSFPFYAFSLEHARKELLEATRQEGCPYTHIFQYGALNQKSGHLSTFKMEKASINILTGDKR